MKRVQVYYNIRRGDYSVRQSGRVIDHVESIILRDVRFNVAPAGRDKVRETGVKNVPSQALLTSLSKSVICHC